MADLAVVKVAWTLPRGETVEVPMEVRVPPAGSEDPGPRFVGHVSDETATALGQLVRRLVLERFGPRHSIDRVLAAIEGLARPSAETQRSLEFQDTKLLYVPGLRTKPIWDVAEVPPLAQFTPQWTAMAAEWTAASHLLRPADAGRLVEMARARLIAVGRWDQFHIHLSGEEVGETARLCPTTAAAVRALGKQVRVGRCYFSAMGPKAVVHRHCGPHNARLRFHLGLIAPDGAELAVHDLKYRWRAGEGFLFDDSYWHEARNDADTDRVVLILDFIHPDLSPVEWNALSAVLWLLETAQRSLLAG
jgi:aspartate beta-hydroxylase